MKRQSTDGYTPKDLAEFREVLTFDLSSLNVQGLRALLKLLPDNAVVVAHTGTTALKLTLHAQPVEEPQPAAFRNRDSGRKQLAPFLLITTGTESVE